MVGFFGEPLPIALLRRLVAALPACRFTFNYGATEAYRITSFQIPPTLPDDLVSLPIGPDRPEYAVSLRDGADAEVEDGAVGELCVEGAPVMLGYWKDPALTASRRLSGRPHSWRSGDFAYRDAAGLLHLVGRQDQMIKIRGHRFDLGEIEAVLRSQPGVRDAVAALVAREAGNAEVRAALLAEPSETIRTAVRLACAKRLPAFARPSRLLMFEQFPLLPSGKVDRMTLQRRLREVGDRSPP
jgi:acyl-coenzyme A synthetase/AMP-(fatty) acid ligase